ncbi:hypothetical protein ACLB2K_047644 [Fragaria x ananassa]
MEEAEALRLKSTAESKYKASNLKSALKYAKRAHRLSPNLDGVATMVTALEILRTAHESSPNPNWIRRKEYDMKLRIKIQDRKMKESSEGLGETFWTACSTCRLLHQFERRYLGQSLVCPSCRKGFEAVEVESGANAANAGVRSSERLRQLGAGGGSGEGRRVEEEVEEENE